MFADGVKLKGQEYICKKIKKIEIYMNPATPKLKKIA